MYLLSISSESVTNIFSTYIRANPAAMCIATTTDAAATIPTITTTAPPT